jgi:hypothetical protein
MKNMYLKSADLKKIYKVRDVFFRRVFNRVLSCSQRKFSNRVILKVLNNRGGNIAAEFSRQSGKTECVSKTIVFLLLFYYPIVKKFNIPHTEYFNIGIFAPQQEQAKTDFNRIKEDLKQVKHKNYYNFEFGEFNGNTITLREEGKPPRTVYCFSASPTSNTESKTLNLIILEEAQLLNDEKIKNTIEPMGAHTNALMVYIGTSGYQKCEFLNKIETLNIKDKIICDCYRAINERKVLYSDTKDPIFLNYEKFINQKKREYGENSDAFKTQYLLKWVLERGQFITYNELMSLEKEYEIPKGWGPAESIYVGIDWGKSYDSTIVTLVRGNGQLIDWLELTGDNYNNQYIEIFKFCKPYIGSIKMIHCDATSNQDMAVDVIKNKFKPYGVKVIGVSFSATTKDFMYKNLHSLMTPILVDDKIIKPSFLSFPKEHSPEKEKFVNQFLNLQKEIANEKWRCNHPDGPGFHDDYCDSCALACYPLRNLAKKKPKNRFSVV